MKRFFASLLNETWLVEEAWLQNMLRLFMSAVNTDIEALQVYKSEKLADSNCVSVRGPVAIIPISGPIFAKPNFITEFFGIGCNLQNIAQDLQFVLDNPDITSILLDVDSPGGTVTGVNECAALIAKANEKKSVTAYVGGTGASAAYWLSSAANEIVLDATGRVGSIGVVVAYPNPKVDDADYIEIVNTSSPNKRPDVSTDKGRATIVGELDALANVFIETVATNRKVSTTKVLNDFGKGGILVGQNAVNAGMADRLGSLEGLISEKQNSVENNSIMFKGEESMNLEKLKAEHPALYVQIVSDAQAAMKASHEAEVATLSTKITGLEKSLADAETAKANLSGRVSDLEKKDVIRSVRDTKIAAEAIQTAALKSSDIPENLYSKVSSQVDYNKFVSEATGFDSAGFTAAFAKEVADWETQLSSVSIIKGVSTLASFGNTDPNAAADDEALSRMLGHIGVKEAK